jgi:hypothetical protein
MLRLSGPVAPNGRTGACSVCALRRQRSVLREEEGQEDSRARKHVSADQSSALGKAASNRFRSSRLRTPRTWQSPCSSSSPRKHAWKHASEVPVSASGWSLSHSELCEPARKPACSALHVLACRDFPVITHSLLITGAPAVRHDGVFVPSPMYAPCPSRAQQLR